MDPEQARLTAGKIRQRMQTGFGTGGIGGSEPLDPAVGVSGKCPAACYDEWKGKYCLASGIAYAENHKAF